MKNETALNLDKLLEGDYTFKERGGREIAANKRFSTLFPKPVKKGWLIFGKAGALRQPPANE